VDILHIIVSWVNVVTLNCVIIASVVMCREVGDLSPSQNFLFLGRNLRDVTDVRIAFVFRIMEYPSSNFGTWTLILRVFVLFLNPAGLSRPHDVSHDRCIPFFFPPHPPSIRRCYNCAIEKLFLNKLRRGGNRAGSVDH
jgi:hypothetical protein